MGQYYKVALVGNEGQIKVIMPDGLKLLEHSYYGNITMKIIEKVLYRDAWNVMRIGDYAQCASLVWKYEHKDEIDDITDEIYRGMGLEKDVDLDYFLINKYTNEYINMTRQEMGGIKIHPLPILCRCEGGFGGGDYRGDNCINTEYMGNWSGDIIHIASGKREEMEKSLKDNGYKDMTDTYVFKEG